MAHCRGRGEEILVGDQSHIIIWEQGGVAQVRIEDWQTHISCIITDIMSTILVSYVFILPIVTNIVNTLDMPTNSRC